MSNGDSVGAQVARAACWMDDNDAPGFILSQVVDWYPGFDQESAGQMYQASARELGLFVLTPGVELRTPQGTRPVILVILSRENPLPSAALQQIVESRFPGTIFDPC